MARIFIVEDEIIFQLELKQRMIELGHEVVGTADNSDDAYSGVINTRPDLVLMDVNIIGEKDGIQTAGLILEKYNVPIVYLTAYSDKTTLERAKVTSPYAYLIKPIEDVSLNISIEVSLSNFKAEKKVKESERKLSITLQSIGDGVIATDDKGNVTLMNPIAERMCGIKYDDAQGLPLYSVFKIINANTKMEIPSPVDEVIRTGKVVELANHTILISLDGTERHIADSAAPIINDDGIIEGVVLVFSDVTESYIQRAKLKESEKLYREVVENASDIIYAINTDGKIIHANSAAYNITGYKHEDFKEMLFTDFVVEEYRAKVKRMMFQQFIKKVKSFYFEVPVLKKESGQLWLGNIITLVFDREKVSGFHIVSRDITLQKEAELKLKQSEEFNRKLVATIPDIVISTDIEGKVVYVNKVDDLKKYGFTEETIIGQNILSFISDQDIDRVVANTKLMYQKPIGPQDYVLKLGNNKNGHFEINGDIILGDGDKPIGMIFIVRDINERKQTEKIIQESEAKYRLLAENSTDLIYFFSFDPKPHYQYISPSCEKLTGYSAEEVYTDPDIFIRNFLVDDNDLNKFKNYIFHGKNDSEPIVERWHKKDGSIIWVEQVINRKFNTDGKIVSFQSTVREITERKAALDSLAESEEKYRSLYENVTLGIYRTTPDGRILMANPAIVKMLGYKDFEELQNKNLEIDNTFYEKSERESFKHKLNTSGHINSHEAIWQHKDGNKIYIQEDAKAIKDNNGNVLYYDGTVLNISEKKAAYEQIEMLSTIVSQSPLSILITDKSGVIEYVNEKCIMATGYSNEELVGNKTSLIKSEKTTIEKYHDLWQTINNGKIWHGELLNKKKNQDYYWIDLLISPIVNTENEITHFVGISEDITQKKIIEFELQEYREKLEHLVSVRTNELRESENKFRALAENIEDVIIRFDTELKHIYVNKSIEMLTGIKREDFIGKTHREMGFPEDLVNIWDDILEKAILEKANKRIEFQLPNGKWIDWILIPEFAENGEVISVVTSSRDITKTIEYEVELEKALLKEKELNELKGRFISTVSHEFRTPLASILSSVQLIKRYSQKWSEEKLNEYYEGIKSSINNLTLMLDDILTVSKNDNSKEIVVNEPHDVKFELETIIKELSPLVEEKINIKLNYNAAHTKYLFDTKYFRLIFVNLISNAIKYNPNGGNVLVDVNDDGVDLEFKVIDDGIGINKKDISKIFDSFYRSKEVENIKGSGLGLPIVKQSVDLLKGNINVESIEGKGSTFTVLLKLEKYNND